ncbi:MAG: CapA family protein [Oscillospiraceae bacterium]|nr:CapA family protein [Oscillospiraceae bacterium]
MAFDMDEWNKRRQKRRELKAQSEKQQKKQTLVLIGIVAFLIVAIICVLIFLLRGQKGETPQPPETTQGLQSQPETVPPTTEPPATRPPDTVIHFAAGGDLNITDKTVATGNVGGGYDYSKVFLDVLPTLAEADVTVMNLEGNVVGMPYGKNSAPPQLLKALKNAGVDLLQTANSQSVTNGLLGLTSTLNAVREAGMEPVGTFASREEYRKTGGFTMLEVKGIRIAVVAFTKGLDGRGIPEGSEDCVNLLYTDYNSTYQKVDTEGITAVLKKVAKEEPDITIALLHWGSEYNSTVSSTQKKICSLMQAQGVDAIIGTHSHYVQQMTFNQKTGQFVAYSLGDFLSDGTQAGTDYSVVLDLEITKDGVTGETKITGYSWTPIYLLDETESGGGLRLLRMNHAIETYEQEAEGSLGEADYLAMKNALERIKARIAGEG